jgi:sialate O-acetylesterase
MKRSGELRLVLVVANTLALLSLNAHAQLTVANLQRYQVIQRDTTSAIATFVDSGACRSGTTKIQLLLQNQSTNAVVGSFSWTELSNVSVSGTSWKAAMTGLPIGGEYKAQFRALNGSGAITDSSAVIQNLLVGDIWVCAGQSNMQGQPGATIDAAHVHTLLTSGLGGSTNSQWGTSPTSGPTTSMGNRLYSLTGVPIGIVYAAAGGTGLTDWFFAAGNNLFTTMSNFVRTKTGWKVGGFLWYQGENEDQQDTWASRYFLRFGKMRDSIRSLSKNPKLPTVVVQLESWDGISDYPLDPYSRWIRWPIIRDQQELVGRADPYSACAPIWNAPGIHISAASEALLGTYCAAAAVRQFYQNRAADPGAGPLFKQSWFQDSTRMSIVVQFDGVKGRITNPADPNHLGFYVMKPSVFNINDSTIFTYGTDSKGQPAKMLKAISSVETSGTDKVIIHLAAAATDSVTIGYGRHIQLVSLSPLTDSTGIPVRTFFNRPIAPSPPQTVVLTVKSTTQLPVISIVGSMIYFNYPASLEQPSVAVYRPDGKLLMKQTITGNSLNLNKLKLCGALIIACKIRNRLTAVRTFVFQ